MKIDEIISKIKFKKFNKVICDSLKSEKISLSNRDKRDLERILTNAKKY